jgi:hypothetical protein
LTGLTDRLNSQVPAADRVDESHHVFRNADIVVETSQRWHASCLPVTCVKVTAGQKPGKAAICQNQAGLTAV